MRPSSAQSSPAQPAARQGGRRASAPPAGLEIAYEPVAALAGGEIVGAEALLRRRLPSGVVQIAARFLPLAEASGLLVEIGRRVIDRACEQAATWQSFRRGATITVNVSARQLADPALPDWVEAVLTRHALPAGLLVLDVTEIVVAEAALEGGPMLQHLRELAALGVRVAVDDAGTGPAAPTYLPFVPVSILKLDGRVVRGVGEGEARLARELIELARERGLVSLAEGVERPEQAAALRDLGCELAQGYAIGRGTTPDGIAALLRG